MMKLSELRNKKAGRTMLDFHVEKSSDHEIKISRGDTRSWDEELYLTCLSKGFEKVPKIHRRNELLRVVA